MSNFIIKKCKQCKLDKVFTSTMSASQGICEPCRLENKKKGDDRK